MLQCSPITRVLAPRVPSRRPDAVGALGKISQTWRNREGQSSRVGHVPRFRRRKPVGMGLEHDARRERFWLEELEDLAGWYLPVPGRSTTWSQVTLPSLMEVQEAPTIGVGRHGFPSGRPPSTEGTQRSRGSVSLQTGGACACVPFSLDSSRA